LAAGLRPDPLGDLIRSPDPLAAIRGPTFKGREGKGGRGGEGPTYKERGGAYLLGEGRKGSGRRPTSKGGGREGREERGDGKGGGENSPTNVKLSTISTV